jgi:hypothetical protein
VAQLSGEGILLILVLIAALLFAGVLADWFQIVAFAGNLRLRTFFFVWLWHKLTPNVRAYNQSMARTAA